MKSVYNFETKDAEKNYLQFYSKNVFFSSSFFGLISGADIVIHALFPDIERDSAKTHMIGVVLERLSSGKFVLVSSIYKGFRTVIHLNNQVCSKSVQVLEDGDVIEVSHCRNSAYPFQPLDVFEGLFYSFASGCCKNTDEFSYFFMILFFSLVCSSFL